MRVFRPILFQDIWSRPRSAVLQALTFGFQAGIILSPQCRTTAGTAGTVAAEAETGKCTETVRSSQFSSHLDLKSPGSPQIPKNLPHLSWLSSKAAPEVCKHHTCPKAQASMIKFKGRHGKAVRILLRIRHLCSASGKEPLPEEDLVQFKPIPEPSPLDGYLLNNQISNCCDQMHQFSTKALQKLHLVENMQTASLSQ